MPHVSRRQMIQGTTAAMAAGTLGGLPVASAAATEPSTSRAMNAAHPHGPYRFAAKIGMVQGDSLTAKFALLRDLGYDGVELDSPAAYTLEDVRAAQRETGLPIHGVVDSVHWQTRLSDPGEDVRERAITALEGAIRDAHAYGGSSVLLVPGRVANADNENHDHVWHRSIAGIRRVLPLAAQLGVFILIENVWNGFGYTHDGPPGQDARRLAAYLDEINSPWVGAYLDLGNHQKYADVPGWVRTLGRRVVKLDVKDWGVDAGWAKIGDGDVPWPAVRAALNDIGFTGWATAEVAGGGRERLADVLDRMRRVLLG